MEKKTKDFIFSFVLIALSIYVVIEGMNIYWMAAAPPYDITQFSISPAFLPVVLGIALFFCAIALCLQSLKSEAGYKTTAKAYWGQIKSSLKPAFTSKNFLSMLGGTIIIAIYTFVLVGLIPYWAASLVFLVALMSFLRADKIWKILIISVVTVGLVMVLFKVVFNAALP